jgi:hypothetical protein
MKALILALLLSAPTYADTLIVLPPPASPVQPFHTVQCAAEGFSADGQTVAGACLYTTTCTQRFCHPPAYTYAVTWKLDGTPTLGAQRATKPDFYDYSRPVVQVHGTWYQLAATSVYGAEALDGSGVASLWQP